MNTVSAVVEQKPEFQTGLKDGIGIALGYIPIALAFGLLSKTTGLTFYETVAMSAFVFAGASQFMTLTLLASGASALEIISTVFIVNIRLLLMTTSLKEKLEQSTFLPKALAAFGLTDETFAVASTRPETLTYSYVIGLNSIAYSSWVICSGLGFFIVNVLPHVAQESMGFALYAMFIALLVPCLVERKTIYLSSCAALANSLLSQVLSTGISIFFSTLFAAVFIEFVYTGEKTS
ncbi:AzlC family ABC transporter permease [Bacillus sp. 165]|uniref:AzlC family ABC transporter permease n=1 Tax=Bacillus sp. 165 TaxID=1529117 RepID=UPI001ADB22F3|nr:AzlC family ABC transporter permease [Bacillus sp. 165]MBO9128465.1 AzlC family ABC transporter permease [Bacillus sp. 165]